MTDYIAAQAFMSRHGITTLTNTARFAEHITAASRWVDAFTHRQYGPHTGAATARYFTPLNCDDVLIDDAYEITSVQVDEGDDGTYETTWSVTDYETDPADGIGANGQSGWPVFQIRAVDSHRFPTRSRRRPVKVTAKWGWSAIPAEVVEATYQRANRFSYEVSVPSGFNTAGTEFGLPATPLARQYSVEALLRPFIRYDRVGVA